MAPGKPYIHKMEASELAELKEMPFIPVYWGPDKNNRYYPANIIYNKYPAKVLVAFSDAFGEKPQVASLTAWPRLGVVKVVLDWMLSCCQGDGLQQVKDIELDISSLTSAKGDGDFSRFFKTAYLLDFAEEYRIKHLVDKLKRELEFQAKGKFPLRVEEVYDVANYFWQNNRDNTAINLMIDSIARNFVKGEIKDNRKRMYDQELAIWEGETGECNCDGEGFCIHEGLPEMLARRINYFEDPENKEELHEVFGKKADVVDDATVGDGGGWDNADGGGENNGGGSWDGAPKHDEGDKENQAPADTWGDEMNEAAAAPSGGAGGW